MSLRKEVRFEMDIAELSMMLEAMEPREVPEEEFMDAVAKTKTMKGLPQDQQLTLYGLFKQYTVGDNTAPQPDESDFVNKYKWYDILNAFPRQYLTSILWGKCREAWNSFKGFPKNNAALAYVYIVTQLLAPSSGEKAGPGANQADGFGVIVSTLK